MSASGRPPRQGIGSGVPPAAAGRWLAARAGGGWARWGREKPAAQETVLPTVTAANAYDRQCQTYYEGADGTLYWVFAAFSPAGSDGENCPNGYRSQLIAAGEESWGSLTLYAYDAVTGKNAREAFAPLVEDWQDGSSAGGRRRPHRDGGRRLQRRRRHVRPGAYRHQPVRAQ